METDFELEGLDVLERRLLTLEKKTAKRVVRRALRDSAKIVVESARAKVPEGTGALRESLGTIARVGKGKNFETMFIGSRAKNKAALALANAGRSKPIRGIFYGHMIERGTVARSNKVSGANRGSVAPQPFLRPALDENAGKVANKFAEELRRGVERVTRSGTT